MHNKSYYTGDASTRLHSWYYSGKQSLTALVRQKILNWKNFLAFTLYFCLSKAIAITQLSTEWGLSNQKHNTVSNFISDRKTKWVNS